MSFVSINLWIMGKPNAAVLPVPV
ncbi:hypothetical protein MED222_06240 [Vibrio sp. MED222]|nr:hypothetical protein MED222_06240 [Vibrio sp. MED222]